MLGLYQAAEQSGFRASGKQAEDLDHLAGINKPVILHVTQQGNLLHYVVLFGIENEKYRIGDPASGIELWDREKIGKAWQSKVLLQLDPGKGFPGRKKKQSNLKWIREWVSDDIHMLVSAVFLGIIISVFSIATAIFSQKLIDQLLPEKNVRHLITGILLFGLILFIKALLTGIKGYFLIAQARDFSIRIVRYFFGNLFSLPKYFFDSVKTGDLIARMNDTGRIQAAISQLAGNILNELLVVLTIITTVTLYNLQAGLLLLFFTPFYFMILWLFHKKIILHQKKAMNAYALNESNYIDVISGINDIQSFLKENAFQKMVISGYSWFQSTLFNLGRVQVHFSLATEVLNIIMLTSLTSLSSHLYLNDVMSLGAVIAIISLSSSIGPSITRLVLFNIRLQEGSVAFSRMKEITDMKSSRTVTGKPLPEKIETLSLDGLCFHYPGGLDLLKDLSFVMRPGTINALLGENGSGKSTLAWLIQRFYDPSAGTIKLNGLPVDAFSVDEYRKLTGYVPQNIKIFNHTLMLNICMEMPENEKKILEFSNWCYHFGFDRYFRKFTRGYDTLLGEEGINISGGQRQLTGLARALYKEPKILILDECTSFMDREINQFTMNLLEKIKKDRIILFITHRIDTALKADNILILENGKISDQGSPETLIYRDNIVKRYVDSLRDAIDLMKN